MNLSHSDVLQRLVRRAKDIPGIVAVGAYGSTATETWTAHSDLDLIFIVEEDAPVNSLHFFFDDVPVDLNLKRRESWLGGNYGWLPPREITALWDPQSLFSGVQPPLTSSSDTQQYRYAHRHRLLKLAKWIGRDDEIADLMAAGATHWIAVSWFHARDMRFPGIDQAVTHWRVHQPEMIDLLIGATRDRRSRYERIAEAPEIALAPVGGLWSEGDLHVTGWHGPPSDTEIAGAKALLAQLADKRGSPG